jgi:hypothetical protein
LFLVANFKIIFFLKTKGILILIGLKLKIGVFTVNKENPAVLPNFLKKGLAQQRTMLISREKGRVELRFIVQLSVGC